MMAFEQLEPFGALADDFRLGQLCALLANVHRDPKRRSQAFAPEDFMPALAAARRAAAPKPRQLSAEERSRAIDRLLMAAAPPGRR